MKSYTMMTIALAMLIAGCGQKKQETTEASDKSEDVKPPVTLKFMWETEPVLTTCESVLHDEKKDVLYVSNINGAPDAKDGNGFISALSMDGKVVELSWVKGLDAPKGMGLQDGKLYVADIDRVHEIDTETGKIVRAHPAEGATFLNDIAVNDGKVYISDSRGGSIYVIEDGKLSTFMSGLAGPNGLLADKGDLLVALWDAKTLNTLDISSKEIASKTDSIDNPDGIEAISNNEYLVSSWNGMVHHVDADWKKTLVLDTRQDSVSSADIEYVRSKNLLLVPTFFKNTVVAYEVVK